MKLNNTAKLIAFVLLAGLLLYGSFLNQEDETSTYPSAGQSENQENDAQNFDRRSTKIHYSKHARCRMECRQIDESEVKEILENGEINYRKSELNTSACRRKFAIEGVSHDNQRLRIIFAPCQEKITVVTCIDLEQEWACSCD